MTVPNSKICDPYEQEVCQSFGMEQALLIKQLVSLNKKQLHHYDAF
jgi:hypothetical protein